MISKDEITAVIPTINRLYELERCIKSIYPYVKEVIVIDNNSSENIQSLEKKYENVHVYTVGYNMGPCAAQNWGIDLAVTPYILLLDNDVELLRWGAKTMTGKSSLRMHVKEAVQSFRILGDKYFEMYSNMPYFSDSPQQLPWFYGCANLVNKQLWQEVGGYNEDYFAYYQECDISAKFWKKSYYVSYNPSLVFAHHDSEVSRDYKKIEYWKTRNLIWFAWEHLPGSIAAFQIIKAISKNLFNYPSVVYQGLRDALKKMPKRDPIKDEFFLKVWRR